MNYSWQQAGLNDAGEAKLARLYYLAGRFIAQKLSSEELNEMAALTEGEDENEEYSQTFVILTSTGYLTEYFRGMGLEVTLTDIHK